jgi:hypothetical protein
LYCPPRGAATVRECGIHPQQSLLVHCRLSRDGQARRGTFHNGARLIDAK